MTEVVIQTAQFNLFATQRQVFGVGSSGSTNNQVDPSASGQALSTTSGFAQNLGQGASSAPGQTSVGPSQPRIEISPVDFGAAAAPSVTSDASAGPSQDPPAVAAPPSTPEFTAQDTSLPLPLQNPLGIAADVTGPELDIVAANVIGAAFAPFQIPVTGSKAELTQPQRSFIFEQHKMFVETIPFATASSGFRPTASNVNAAQAADTASQAQTTDAGQDQGGTDATKAVTAYNTAGTAIRGAEPRVASTVVGIIA